MSALHSLVAGLAIALLAGCATKPATAPLQPAPKVIAAEAVASLAVGNCELATAADYTGNALARRKAAQLLKAGQIDLAAAVKAQGLADQVRTALDAACRNPKADADPAHLAKARGAAAQLRALLETKP